SAVSSWRSCLSTSPPSSTGSSASTPPSSAAPSAVVPSPRTETGAAAMTANPSTLYSLSLSLLSRMCALVCITLVPFLLLPCALTGGADAALWAQLPRGHGAPVLQRRGAIGAH